MSLTGRDLLDADCWLCAVEAITGEPTLGDIQKVVCLNPSFIMNLCEHHEVDLAAKLIKAD